MKCLWMIVLMLAGAVSSPAALVMTIKQDGSDILVTATGSANTTDLTYGWIANVSRGVYPDPTGYLVIGSSGQAIAYTGATFTGASLWTTTDYANSSTGDTVGIFVNEDTLYLPVGYVSGTAVNGSSRFNGVTLADWGVSDGQSAVYTWGSGANADSLTVTVVPEPATLSLVGIIAGLGFFIRRRFMI